MSKSSPWLNPSPVLRSITSGNKYISEHAQSVLPTSSKHISTTGSPDSGTAQYPFFLERKLHGQEEVGKKNSLRDLHKASLPDDPRWGERKGYHPTGWG